MYELDETDRRLIALLRTDARRPVAGLAAELGLSRATVRARIDRLVAEEVVQGFTVVLRPAADHAPVRAVTMIEIEGHASDRVARRLQGMPEIRTIHSTNGRWDLVIEVEVPDLEAFDAVLRRIRLVEGITASESSLLLSRRKG